MLKAMAALRLSTLFPDPSIADGCSVVMKQFLINAIGLVSCHKDAF